MRGSGLVLGLTGTDSLHLDINLAEVLQKGNGERVTVNGGNNGAGLGNTLDLGLLDDNVAVAIKIVATKASDCK